MTRTDIINYFINKHKFSKYLEIGVHAGQNIEKIVIPHKDGVDPGLGKYANLSKFVNYRMTSDDFFNHIKDRDIKYDFIFIDGLHICEQTDKDFENSFKHLNEGGIIMFHDTIPPTYESQVVPRIQGGWTGDVWKTVVRLRITRSDLKLTTVDTDMGCTIVERGSQELYAAAPLDQCLMWDYFEKNKKQLLNIITVEQFSSIF